MAQDYNLKFHLHKGLGDHSSRVGKTFSIELMVRKICLK